MGRKVIGDDARTVSQPPCNRLPDMVGSAKTVQQYQGAFARTLFRGKEPFRDDILLLG